MKTYQDSHSDSQSDKEKQMATMGKGSERLLSRPRWRTSRALGLVGLSLATLFVFSVQHGCGDGKGGDNGQETDGGVDSADTGINEDAWTFGCPEEQPSEYHVCVAGAVTDIVTQERVEVPSGAVMQRWVRDKEDQINPYFPKVLEAETRVRSGGRFIFPSVEYWYDMPGGPIYYMYDLKLVAEIPGYIVPVNRYGSYHHLNYRYFYVIKEEDASTWEANWDPVCGEASVALDVGGPYRTVVGVCYGDNDDMPQVPSGWANPTPGYKIPCRFANAELSWCGRYLMADRLSFPSECLDHDPFATQNSSGLGVTFVQNVLTETLQGAVPECEKFETEDFSKFYKFPQWGPIGTEAEDPIGPVAVYHSMSP